jgi:two-component system, NtrC family, nitrogen regulation response regulator NtrX
MPTVVLVENERQLREMLSGILEEHGFTVIVSPDVLGAVAAIRERAEAPELVLLDRRVAQGAEPDLLDWMRSIPGMRDVPIVVFTVHGTFGQDVVPPESLRDAFDAELLLAIVEGICHPSSH